MENVMSISEACRVAKNLKEQFLAFEKIDQVLALIAGGQDAIDVLKVEIAFLEGRDSALGGAGENPSGGSARVGI